MANAVVNSIVNTISSEGAKIGGATYKKIKTAFEQRSKVYAETLDAIARRLKANEIPPEEAVKATTAASLVYATSIAAQEQQIALAAVQSFLNSVIAATKGAINSALPIPIL